MTDATEPETTRDEEAEREPTARTGRSGGCGFCSGCLVTVIAIVVVAIVVLSMLFSSPEELVAYGQRTLSGPSTVEQAITTTEDAQERVLRGVRPVVALKVTDADVNAYIVEHSKELSLPKGLKDPRVAFGEGFAEASVRTKIGFVVPVRVRIKMRPEVSDGQLALHPIGGRAGKLGLPSGMRKKIARTAGGMIQERLDGAGFDLQDVELRKGELIVRGKLRPTAEDEAQ
ncbi:MAG: hypothetical protein ACE5JM_17800 [Armatimonadota bacterium]